VVDLWSGGTAVFTNLVAVATVVMGIHTRSFTWVHWAVYVVRAPRRPCQHALVGRAHSARLLREADRMRHVEAVPPTTPTPPG
jgi:hypothetical protein